MSAAVKAPKKRGPWRSSEWQETSGRFKFGEEEFASLGAAIRKAMPKDGLVKWGIVSVAEGVAQIMAELDSINLEIQGLRAIDGKTNEVLRRLGELSARKKAIIAQLHDPLALKEIPYQNRDRKGAIGKRFHDVAESLIAGQHIDAELYPDDVRGYIQSFVQWYEYTKPEYLAIACSVFSREYGYATTIDAIVELPDGRRAVVQYTTSKDTYPDHAVQLAGAARAEFIALPDGTEHPMPEIDCGIVLVVSESGCTAYEWEIDEEVFGVIDRLSYIAWWLGTSPKPREIDLTQKVLL